MPLTALIDIDACRRALAFVADLATAQEAGSPRTPAEPQPVPAREVARFLAELATPGSTGNLAAALRHQAHDPSYPPALTVLLSHRLDAWLLDLERATLCNRPANGGMPVEWLADLIDLQQPWLHGHSRNVAVAAQQAASRIGLGELAQQYCYRAGLLHGFGRGAVPAELWNAPGPLPPAVREQLQLAPYWTLRALHGIGSLATEIDIASWVGERLDGSGNFRGAAGDAIPIEGQVLAAAAAWVALQSPRPWRDAHLPHMAGKLLLQEAAAGRFHVAAAEALTGMQAPPARPVLDAAARITLSEREAAVLRAISQGHTNKEVARQLAISPRTVGTHVESVFRKLRCTTRAAAALKALSLRLI